MQIMEDTFWGNYKSSLSGTAGKNGKADYYVYRYVYFGGG